MSRHSRSSFYPLISSCLMVGCALLAGCRGGHEAGGYEPGTGGNPANGKALIQSYGCGSCHIVPGIRTARGLVGPPLLYYSRRTIIAGELPNSPDNLARWIENPQAIEPETAMPNLGVSGDKARDMAAYLYTLR